MTGLLAMGAVGLFLSWLARMFWDDGRFLAAAITVVVLVTMAIGMFNIAVADACNNDLVQIVARGMCGGYYKQGW